MTLSIATNLTTNEQNYEAKSNSVSMFCLKRTVDLSANNLADNGSIKIFNQPAGTRLSKVFYAVQTAEGATLTFDIGVGLTEGDEDNIVDGANGNSTATLAVVHPAFDVVSSDAAILLTVRDAADAAIIYVECEFTQAVAP